MRLPGPCPYRSGECVPRIRTCEAGPCPYLVGPPPPGPRPSPSPTPGQPSAPAPRSPGHGPPRALFGHPGSSAQPLPRPDPASAPADPALGSFSRIIALTR
ncbi:hypothetical protein C0Q61_07295 [Streptomyces albidoflavus]|nr:hypothetical protein C0Q61_07295 [Streptomyces albidoflavus]